jgi:hypothetical protein
MQGHQSISVVDFYKLSLVELVLNMNKFLNSSAKCECNNGFCCQIILSDCWRVKL